MDAYVTGETIKRLREARRMTQAELARKLDVGDKAVSKWETGKGLPDISLLEPLAAALGVSILELVSGAPVLNQNKSPNMLRGSFYACPVCGNLLHAMGAAVVSRCGIALPQLTAEDADSAHQVALEPVEDETYLTLDHPMTKAHYISFLAYVTADRLQWVKLYPEGPAACRMRLQGRGMLYLYCNRHGLMRVPVSPPRPRSGR